MAKSLISILCVLTVAWCDAQNRVLYSLPTLTVEQGKINGYDLSVYKKFPSVKLTVGSHPDFDIHFAALTDSLYVEPRSSAPPIAILSVRANGVKQDLLLRTKKMIPHLFQYRARTQAERIVVMGGFNDWSRTALPMEDGDGDGTYERTVYLEPKRHEYKFVVDGDEIIDPNNPVFVSNNIGGWNSVLDLSEYAEKSVGRFVKSSSGADTLTFRFLPPEDDAMPEKIIVIFNNTVLPQGSLRVREDGAICLSIEQLGDGLLRVTGRDEKGRVIPENHTILKHGRPIDPARDNNDWHFSIVYSLMVDRFLDADLKNTRRTGDRMIHPLAEFHGGDLAGVIRKLEEGYFSELGVNVIWLSPVGLVPDSGYVEWVPPRRKFTGYHGYWPIRPRTLDPRFGTEGELADLVDIAHRQGIKVILDFVSNHVHEEHPYFRLYREWFGSMYMPDGEVNIRKWDGVTRLTTWFDSFLPSYDFVNSQEAIDQVVEDALWWLETFHLDGFRQDAVKHVPHKFWRTLTAEMKRRYPGRDYYQIGETFGSDDLILSYVSPGELSAQFNFAIYFNARGPFSADEADFLPLDRVIRNNLSIYGPLHLMGNITSSHDQVRFMAFADHQLTFADDGKERSFINPPGPVRNESSYAKLANFYAFNCTLPGIPVLYYGDEIGMIGAGDPDNRRPMRFGPNVTAFERKLLQRISLLNRMRRKYPSLALGDYVALVANGPILAYAKIYFGEIVVFAVNNGSSAKKIEFRLPVSTVRLADLFTNEELSVDNGSVSLTLGPYSHVLLAGDTRPGF